MWALNKLKLIQEYRLGEIKSNETRYMTSLSTGDEHDRPMV